jgi:hypothetical protein
MYESAKPELDRILELVATMPDDLKAKGFEILLAGYVASLRPAVPSGPGTQKAKETLTPPPTDPLDAVPQELRTRVKTLAGQTNLAVPTLLSVFDFAVDPFTLGSFVLPGANTADKARKVALLVGVRSYIGSGKWTADWNEVKAACVDHGCYDGANFSQAMSKGKGGIFKNVTVGSSIEISASGQAEAKKLLASLIPDAAK